MQFCRRGQENIEFLRPNHYQQVTDASGLKYWKAAMGEATKNHRTDSEDIRTGSFMLHETNIWGLNPGDYYELFLTKLDSSAEYLFGQPQREKKAFKIEENPTTWYSKWKIGKNTVGDAMPIISVAAGLSKITNHQLRSSAINALVDAEFQVREIRTVSKHKSDSSVDHYAKKPSIKRQIAMSRAISNGGKVPKLDESIPSTSGVNLKKDNDTRGKIKTKKTNDPSKIKGSKKEEEKSPFDDDFESAELLNDLEETFSQIDEDFELDEMMTQVEKSWSAEQFLKKEQEMAERRFKFAEKCWKKSKK